MSRAPSVLALTWWHFLLNQEWKLALSVTGEVGLLWGVLLRMWPPPPKTRAPVLGQLLCRRGGQCLSAGQLAPGLFPGKISECAVASGGGCWQFLEAASQSRRVFLSGPALSAPRCLSLQKSPAGAMYRGLWPGEFCTLESLEFGEVQHGVGCGEVFAQCH